ncbi:alpha/beta fold hydrolase [Aurantiacibacter marinus]|uniref:Alpha/beta hydrolase n=1 Tax=Aurantiacibacter marinus TaxID=874156 RepID=A0A0H0XN62_9SPHN|nr:alpha/beta hydrolase [Aurantiacibacter marinus]KLI64038.1 alpha/beta hydrolase [Aurantiacibacter marinus]
MGNAATRKQSWQDGTWESADGLTLHYRDYAGKENRPPILCIPGLTRNARDFEPVADAFAGEWRVIVAELRGRGESDYSKNPETYKPATYVEDIAGLLEHLGLEKVVALGTSLGGIVSMLMAFQHPGLFAGVVLNDIGPDVDEAGLDRIRDYVGHGGSYPTWMHAARALQETSDDIYPDYEMSDWLRLAKRMMVVGNSGRISFDYDMKIAEPFLQPPPAPVDMWPLFGALAGRPVLALRGELSDILSPETLAKMKSEMPEMEAVTVPGVGHVPTLEEPSAQAAIARLLGKIA